MLARFWRQIGDGCRLSVVMALSVSARETPPGTIGLIAISLGVFLADLLLDHRIIEWGAKSHLIWSGEWHRLIAANFIHSGIPHLAVDMFALFIFGRIVEPLAGLGRYIIVYLLGGIAGFAVSLLASPDVYSVGSSASIFAFMGYTLHHRIRNLPLRWLPIDTALAQVLGINLVLGLAVPNIDQFAHLGGLLGGFLCGSLLGVDRRPQPFVVINPRPEPSRRVERVVAFVLLFAMLAAGLFPVGVGKWLRPVAPAVAEAMEARYGRFFAPFVASDAAVLWLDPRRSDSDWQFVDSRLSRHGGPPIAFGVFWRWTRGGDREENGVYRVAWERRSGRGAEWAQVAEDVGVVTDVDRVRGRIIRRSMIVVQRPDQLYGEWRVRVHVNGIAQFEKEYVVTQ